MPAAIAIPAIASVASAGLGYLGSRQTSEQKALLGQQTAAAKSQSDLAATMQRLAGEQSTLTNPAYKQALDYYQSLAGGGGAAKTMQAVMPDVNRLNEQYRGAAVRINSSLRGPARDQALAELVRQHAGQVAELTGAPRMQANDKLLAEGNAGANRAAGYMSGAVGAFGNAGVTAGNAFNAVNTQQNNRNTALHSAGEDFAKLWAPYLKGKLTSGKSTSAGLTSMFGGAGTGAPW